MTDHDYMNIALELARRGVGKTNPNPAVGCLIVKGDHIVGQGWHKKCGGPHAEIFALRQAG
ncbi:MAG TPA: bifunctional diaminohydroxyphosphoribosylaminopyrimidine deaminase/5-amino-6-(5-phosphoribosylamino)uracil reductase, partial [Candidatus Bathyarchaeia archaeon]|nr:bifunctional diaminohydroxyphosphoribosylaminopyrimidine deaminase/5-amino-6-(5-phosphoribosylamino)uracil reductase [Candidatus Bathyarchaeia archaeon]